MKGKFIYIILLACTASILFSCSKEEDPVPELPAWNKNRTTTIQVYTTLSGTPILEGGQTSADFTSVSSRIRPGLQSVAVLHRADATLSGTAPYNPAIAMGAKALRVPLFALHRFNGQKAEGTGVLIGHTYAKSEIQRIADGCAYLSVATRANASIPMTFGTVSFENQAQVDAGAEVIRNNMNDATVVVGIVAKELAGQLKSKFQAQSYRFSTVEGSRTQANQVIFVVSTNKWVLRESAEQLIGNSGLAAYDLQIESF